MKRAWFSEGLRFALRSLGKRSLNPFRLVHRVTWWAGRVLFGPRCFLLKNRQIPYFLHPLVINTERIVEISLGRRFLEGEDPAEVLEIGNVLAVFSRVDHRVVDKYEPGSGVENLDIMDFQPDERLRRILCLSTLEHVGIDEEPRDERKALLALKKIPSWLTSEGEALITIPLGHHPRLDTWLTGERGRTREDELTESLPGAQISFLQRQNAWNVWRQVDRGTARGARYGYPFACANVVAVIYLQGETRQP
ncbi:MAG: hypothetical protein K0U98_23745 [Deltaproteobacteria bacterium]|nr:hypothetical protein [Deltaproteobacteria bacterium]